MADIPQNPSTQEIQPELFTELEGIIIPSEDAVVDPNFFRNEVMDAVHKRLEGRRPTLQEKMDTLRRERVAKERQDFLDSQKEEAGLLPLSQIGSAVTGFTLQGQFPIDFERSEKPEGKKVAFGRYVKKAIYEVAGEQMSPNFLLDAEKRLMTPDGMASLLYRAPEDRSKSDEAFYVDDILLNQVEYRLLPRAPKALARSSSARTYGHLDVREDSELHGRADRSITHTFELKIEAMTEHRKGMIQRLDDIEALVRLARNPGKAWVSPEEMKRLLGSAWSEFDNMVHTLALREKWDEEHTNAARSALLHNITTGNQRERVEKFGNMLIFTKRYIKNRVSLIDNRLEASGEYLETDEEKPTSTSQLV